MASRIFKKFVGKERKVLVPENPRLEELDSDNEDFRQYEAAKEQQLGTWDGINRRKSRARFDHSFIHNGICFRSVLEFLEWMMANRDYVDLRKFKSFSGKVNDFPLELLLTGKIGDIEEISEYDAKVVGVGYGEEYIVGNKRDRYFTVYTRIASLTRPRLRLLGDDAIVQPWIPRIRSTDRSARCDDRIEQFNGSMHVFREYLRQLPVPVIELSDSDDDVDAQGVNQAGGEVEGIDVETSVPCGGEAETETSNQCDRTDVETSVDADIGLKDPTVDVGGADVDPSPVSEFGGDKHNSENVAVPAGHVIDVETSNDDVETSRLARSERMYARRLKKRTASGRQEKDVETSGGQPAAETSRSSKKLKKTDCPEDEKVSKGAKRARGHKKENSEDEGSIDSDELLSHVVKRRKGKASEQKPLPQTSNALSTEFYDMECHARWNVVVHRRIMAERPADPVKYRECGFTSYLEYLKVSSAATKFDRFNKQLVLEFYANMKEDIEEEESAWFQKVYVRGKVVEFSPQLMNKCLGNRTNTPSTVFAEDVSTDHDAMAMELTGAVDKVWPATGNLSVSNLSSRYFCLYMVAVHNWLPSTNNTVVTKDMATLLYCLGKKHKVNLGKLIYNSICDCGQKTRKEALIHPSLITAVLVRGGVEVRAADEWISVQPLKPTARTLSGRIVKDLPWNPTANRADVEEAARQARLAVIAARASICRDIIAKHEAELAALEAERADLLMTSEVHDDSSDEDEAAPSED